MQLRSHRVCALQMHNDDNDDDDDDDDDVCCVSVFSVTPSKKKVKVCRSFVRHRRNCDWSYHQLSDLEAYVSDDPSRSSQADC